MPARLQYQNKEVVLVGFRRPWIVKPVDSLSMGGGNGNEEYSQEELDNHADQMNPNNDAYESSRGDDYDDDDDDYEYSQEELDNHADQMNPNNDAYESSRG